MAKKNPPGEEQHWSVKALRERIDASGMSTAEFSRRELVRAPNTCYRWLRSESPIPLEVRRYLLGTWRILDDAKPTTTGVEDDQAEILAASDI